MHIVCVITIMSLPLQYSTITLDLIELVQVVAQSHAVLHHLIPQCPEGVHDHCIAGLAAPTHLLQGLGAKPVLRLDGGGRGAGGAQGCRVGTRAEIPGVCLNALDVPAVAMMT